LGNRAKESLLVDFINQTDLSQLDDKASVIEAFFTFALAVQLREAQELISSENLTPKPPSATSSTHSSANTPATTAPNSTPCSPK
jgi:type I site-specific restriction-modification system R (restriction) subunit